MSKEDVKLEQLADIREIPQLENAAWNRCLPVSDVIWCAVVTKAVKAGSRVRQFLLWKTNKQEVSRDFPGYVLHITDCSPNRKMPLNPDVPISNSVTQQSKLINFQEKTIVEIFVRGWTVINEFGHCEKIDSEVRNVPEFLYRKPGNMLIRHAAIKRRRPDTRL